MTEPDKSRWMADVSEWLFMSREPNIAAIFRGVAAGAVGKDELSDDEKVAIAYVSGARVSLESHPDDRRKMVLVTEPCGVVKIDGRWHVFTKANPPGGRR